MAESTPSEGEEQRFPSFPRFPLNLTLPVPLATQVELAAPTFVASQWESELVKFSAGLYPAIELARLLPLEPRSRSLDVVQD